MANRLIGGGRLQAGLPAKLRQHAREVIMLAGGQMTYAELIDELAAQIPDDDAQKAWDVDEAFNLQRGRDYRDRAPAEKLVRGRKRIISSAMSNMPDLIFVGARKKPHEAIVRLGVQAPGRKLFCDGCGAGPLPIEARFRRYTVIEKRGEFYPGTRRRHETVLASESATYCEACVRPQIKAMKGAGK